MELGNKIVYNRLYTLILVGQHLKSEKCDSNSIIEGHKFK